MVNIIKVNINNIQRNIIKKININKFIVMMVHVKKIKNVDNQDVINLNQIAVNLVGVNQELNHMIRLIKYKMIIIKIHKVINKIIIKLLIINLKNI